MTNIESPRSLLTMVGTQLAVSDWLEVTRHKIDQFALATHDRHWIHVDEPAADALGTRSAHQYLVVSLLAPLVDQVLVVDNCELSVNYGLNRLRFPSAAPPESRIRLHSEIVAADEVGDDVVQVVVACTIECDQTDSPVCTADGVFRYYG